MSDDPPTPLPPETAEDRTEIPRMLRRLADRYEEGDKIGAILVAAMLTDGYMTVLGVTPGVQDRDLLVYVGGINAAAGAIVATVSEAREEDPPPADLMTLRTVRGGSA